MTDESGGKYKYYLINACFLVTLDLCAAKSYSSGNTHTPCFKPLPPGVVQHHLQISRHLPLCLVYRKHDEGSKLENTLCQFWKHRDRSKTYSHWEVGALAVDKGIVPGLALPDHTPTLRCHLGLATPFDFTGKRGKKSLAKWFDNLTISYADQLPECSVPRLEKALLHHPVVVVGFSDEEEHYDMEIQLYEIKNMYSDLKVFFVHPHSLQLMDLVDFLGLEEDLLPALVIVENKTGLSKPDVTILPSKEHYTLNRIKLYMMAREMPAVQLTTENFVSNILTPGSGTFTPALVLFYGPWKDTGVQYMYALQNTVSDLEAAGADFRYGLVDVSVDQRIVSRFIDGKQVREYPFTVLYYTDTKGGPGSGVQIKQDVLYDRPTPDTVADFLKNKARLDILNKNREKISFRPFIIPDILEFCTLLEGPLGCLCSNNHHNQTDHQPKRYKHRKKKLKPKKAHIMDSKSYKQQAGDLLEKHLDRVGNIPVLTNKSWVEIIERSHGPAHPFLPEEKWRGEFTKVALVIFIQADCRSCDQNMETFQELRKAVSFIDGGATYLVNCTTDRPLCVAYGVTGFPTLIAFRGFGWLGRDECLSKKSRQRPQYVRMDYHGVLQVRSIMDWFSTSVSTASVTDVQFEQMYHFSMPEDVYLVADLIPKQSHFLPRIPKNKGGREYFFPYECFRLVCEHLYGQIGCYAKFSSEIPKREFKENDQEMIVSMVSLYRKDGASATVMKMGESLHNVLEEESDTNIHKFHHPHRYNLPSKLKCEDNHALCTDIIAAFSVDHGRLPVTHMTTAMFHAKNSFSDGLLVLVALVHHDNITQESKFMKSLTRAAEDLYQEIRVVTVDVDQHPTWGGQFVPKGYRRTAMLSKDIPHLYIYPRLCIIKWQDHRHAAFYPPLDTKISREEPFRFRKVDIIKFVRHTLSNLDQVMVETEHF